MRPLCAVDAIDALRPAQPQLAVIGRRAEQVEELPRLDRQRLGRGLDDQMLVFGIDPVVRDMTGASDSSAGICGSVGGGGAELPTMVGPMRRAGAP